MWNTYLSIGRRASEQDDARVGYAAAPAAGWRYYIAYQLVAGTQGSLRPGKGLEDGLKGGGGRVGVDSISACVLGELEDRGGLKTASLLHTSFTPLSSSCNCSY